MYVRHTGRRRRLGQYDSAYQGYSNADPSLNPSSSDPSVCSWWDDIWPSQACALARGQQQINSVAINAAAANDAAVAAGQPAPYNVPQIQAAANQQAQAFAAENALIFNPPGSNSNDPANWPWYYWVLGGGVLLLFIVKR